ncbi:MAG: M15 family metallopeptidase [Treponema sp.]|nr:M15 family metallopeptidase [Treponema sp.]
MKVSLCIALLILLSGVAVFAQTPGRTPVNGELALRALQEGFPDRVSEIAFIDNDWTVRVAGQLFFWAEGRLLPEAERHLTDYFGPHSFYTIPERVPSPSDFSPQYIELLRERSNRNARMARRDVHRAFQAALYGGSTRREIEAMQRRVQFLGFRVTVHKDIVYALASVEAEIMEWYGANAFIATLGSIAGYSWRQIAETQRMSFHSWGLAIDILPRNHGREIIYWLWEQRRNPDWMLIPLENRWSPPPQVIEAFERQGFIWGGKWAFFDNMHFEFRPELHAYTRLLAGNTRRIVGYGRSLHHVYPDNLRP